MGAGELISAISSAATGIGSFIGNIVQNRKQRQWNEKMYNKERADNLEYWNMQNAYNAPTAQMQRLKEAGLNPNLVYGNGTVANNASAPDNAKHQPLERKPVNLDLHSPIAAYQNFKSQTAQTELTQKNIEIAEQDKLLKSLTGANMVIKNLSDKFDYDLKSELKETTVNMAEENLRKVNIENQIALNRDEREAITQATNLQEAAQRIISSRIQNAQTEQQTRNLKEQLESIQKDNTLKDLEIELAKKGIYKGDPAWMRVLLQYIQNPESQKQVQDFLKDIKNEIIERMPKLPKFNLPHIKPTFKWPIF